VAAGHWLVFYLDARSHGPRAFREAPARIIIFSSGLKACFIAVLTCMYAQKFNVNVVIRGEAKPCPLEWLDQFCMRNFTNAAEFDDTLPMADGQVETSFRLTPERFAEGLAAWLTQRGKGEGQPVIVQVTPLESNPKPASIK
jgi:hypothetical protein